VHTRFWVRKLKRKKLLRSPRHRGDDYIKMAVKEVVREDVDYLYQAQDTL
jgi:hypothetical protein